MASFPKMLSHSNSQPSIFSGSEFSSLGSKIMGELFKRSRKNDNRWLKRYVVWDGGELTYFPNKSSSDKEPSFKMNLDEMSSVVKGEVVDDMTTFVIKFTDQSELCLGSKKREVTSEWLTILNRAINSKWTSKFKQCTPPSSNIPCAVSSTSLNIIPRGSSMGSLDSRSSSRIQTPVNMSNTSSKQNLSDLKLNSNPNINYGSAKPPGTQKNQRELVHNTRLGQPGMEHNRSASQNAIDNYNNNNYNHYQQNQAGFVPNVYQPSSPVHTNHQYHAHFPLPKIFTAQNPQNAQYGTSTNNHAAIHHFKACGSQLDNLHANNGNNSSNYHLNQQPSTITATSTTHNAFHPKLATKPTEKRSLKHVRSDSDHPTKVNNNPSNSNFFESMIKDLDTTEEIIEFQRKPKSLKSEARHKSTGQLDDLMSELQSEMKRITIIQVQINERKDSLNDSFCKELARERTIVRSQVPQQQPNSNLDTLSEFGILPVSPLPYFMQSETIKGSTESGTVLDKPTIEMNYRSEKSKRLSSSPVNNSPDSQKTVTPGQQDSYSTNWSVEGGSPLSRLEESVNSTADYYRQHNHARETIVVPKNTSIENYYDNNNLPLPIQSLSKDEDLNVHPPSPQSFNKSINRQTTTLTIERKLSLENAARRAAFVLSTIPASPTSEMSPVLEESQQYHDEEEQENGSKSVLYSSKKETHNISTAHQNNNRPTLPSETNFTFNHYLADLDGTANRLRDIEFRQNFLSNITNIVTNSNTFINHLFTNSDVPQEHLTRVKKCRSILCHLTNLALRIAKQSFDQEHREENVEILAKLDEYLRKLKKHLDKLLRLFA